MEVLTYHFTRCSKSYVPNLTLLSIQVGSSFLGGEAWEMCLSVRSIKKLDPTLNPNLANIFVLDNQDPTLMIINHILMVS